MNKISYTTALHKFSTQGEKTGWTYIEVPADVAQKLKPGNKKSFRVKGKLDAYPIAAVALLPMGGGSFILPFNASMRKGTGKREGSMLKVQLEEDTKPFKFNKDFLLCLHDEPVAAKFFKTLPGSHQRYFSKCIDDAKTVQTKARRIAISVTALSYEKGYGEMLRELKKKKE